MTLCIRKKHQDTKCARYMVLFIVTIALLFDSMLVTSIVPILPSLIYDINHPDGDGDINTTTTTTTTQTSLCQTEYPNNNKFYNCNNNSLNKHSKNNKDILIKSSTKSTDLWGESTEIGILFAAKPLAQVVTNSIVGLITNRLGYSLPLFFGLMIGFGSTMMYAFSTSYAMLLSARIILGFSSSFTSVAGLGLVADKYPDDKQRGNVMAIALSGLAMGLLVGPPFGGVTYEFISKRAPFFILAGLALFDGCLQTCVLDLKVAKEAEKGASLWRLMLDPYIAITAGALCVGSIGIGVLEPSLPLFMMDTMHASTWQQGIAFLPSSISYLIGANIFGKLAYWLGRWMAALIALIGICVSLFYIPYVTEFYYFIAPCAIIGFGIGMIDSSMMPMLAHIVDQRHNAIYGNVYAIGNGALCCSFIISPILSATLVPLIGFKGLCWTTACIAIIYSPLLIFLKFMPQKDKIDQQDEINTN